MNILTKETARHPKLDPDFTHAFDEVAHWLQCSSDRISMMCVPEPWTTNAGEGELSLALPLWSELAQVAVPKAIANSQKSSEAQTTWSRGGPFVFPSRSGNDTKRKQPPYAVFSAMDRHLRRHVLRGQRWITRFSMSCDADHIQACINSHPEARVAWSYLLWLMGVFGVTELRLLRSSCGAMSYAHGMNFQGIYPYRGTPDLGQSEREWLEMHASATFLTAIWKESFQIGLGAVATQYVEWGKGLLSPHGLFRWLAAVHRLEQSVFVAQGRYGVTLKACDNSSKPKTNNRCNVGNGSRALESMAERGLIKDINGDWSSGLLSRPAPNSAMEIKLHRLFGVDGDLHFVVFGIKTLEKNSFVARLVEYTLETHGVDTKSAVSALRSAVKQYLAIYGPTGLSDRGKQAPQSLDSQMCGTQYREFSTDIVRLHGGWQISFQHWPIALRGLQGKWRRHGENMYSANNDFEAVHSWVQSVADVYPASTLSIYARCIEKLVFWAVMIREKTLSDLDQEDIRDFSVFLAAPPKRWVEETPFTRESPNWRPFKKGLDQSSVKVVVSVVKHMYVDWQDGGYLKFNPMASFKLGHESVIYHWLTRKDWSLINFALQRLPENPDTRRLKAVIFMLKECSMTVKDAVALTYQHLQMDQYDSANYIASLPCKGFGNKVFVIGGTAMALLKAHLQDRKTLSSDGRLGRYADIAAMETPLIGALYHCAARDLNSKICAQPADVATSKNSTGRIQPVTLTKIVKEFMVSVARATESPPDEDFLSRADHWLFNPSRQSDKRRREILIRKIMGNYTNEMVDTPEIEMEDRLKIVLSRKR